MQVGTVSISATELCQIVPSTLPFAILSLLSPCRINNLRVINACYAFDFHTPPPHKLLMLLVYSVELLELSPNCRRDFLEAKRFFNGFIEGVLAGFDPRRIVFFGDANALET